MTLCRIVEIAFYDVSILLIKFDLFEFSDKFNIEKKGLVQNQQILQLLRLTSDGFTVHHRTSEGPGIHILEFTTDRNTSGNPRYLNPLGLEDFS